MKNLEQILREKLRPNHEPDRLLNISIINQAKELKKMKRKPLKSSVIATTLILVLTLGSAGVFAAVHYLSASETAKIATESTQLENAFKEKGSTVINETAHSSGYITTLLGTASGENLIPAFSEVKENSSIIKSKSYAVIAISKDDGSNMPEISSNEYKTFCISPLIAGFDSKTINNGRINAGIISFVKNGIQYELLECDDLEIFSERGVQLGIINCFGEEAKAFSYNKKAKAFELNHDYKEFAALFTLPLDKSKADEEMVKQYIAVLNEKEGSEDSQNNSINQYSSNKDVNKWITDIINVNSGNHEKWKCVLENAEPIDSSKQIVSADKDGFIEVNTKDGAFIGYDASNWNYKPGETVITECRSDDTLSGTIAESFTLNKDGTFTYLEFTPVK